MFCLINTIPRYLLFCKIFLFMKELTRTDRVFYFDKRPRAGMNYYIRSFKMA